MSSDSNSVPTSYVSRSVSVRASIRSTVRAWEMYVETMDGVQQLGHLGPARALGEVSDLRREMRMDLWSNAESGLATGGGVEFRHALQGPATEVRIVLSRGEVDSLIGGAWEKSELAEALNKDLFRFKQLVELGEVPTTFGQPQGAALRSLPVEVSA